MRPATQSCCVLAMQSCCIALRRGAIALGICVCHFPPTLSVHQHHLAPEPSLRFARLVCESWFIHLGGTILELVLASPVLDRVLAVSQSTSPVHLWATPLPISWQRSLPCAVGFLNVERMIACFLDLCALIPCFRPLQEGRGCKQHLRRHHELSPCAHSTGVSLGVAPPSVARKSAHSSLVLSTWIGVLTYFFSPHLQAVGSLLG